MITMDIFSELEIGDQIVLKSQPCTIFDFIGEDGDFKYMTRQGEILHGTVDDIDYIILGYYIHKDDEEISARNVMVFIETGEYLLTGYCPVGQHFEVDYDFFRECVKITKREYMNASRGMYTPSEYI